MRLVLTGIFVLLFCGFAIGQEDRMAGKLRAPVMKLVDLAGKKIDTREFAGKTIVYNLWFVGCPPCVDEIPKLNAIVDEYPDVVFIGLSTSNAAAITKFTAKQRFKYRLTPSAGKEMLINFGDNDGNGNLSVRFPTHVVINRDGYIEYRASGLKGVDGIRETLSRLAAKK